MSASVFFLFCGSPVFCGEGGGGGAFPEVVGGEAFGGFLSAGGWVWLRHVRAGEGWGGLGGLLLGNAVQGAAFFDEIEAVDGDDFTIGEKLADHAGGAVVIAVLTEGGDEDGVVCDEEVHVGCGEDG